MSNKQRTLQIIFTFAVLTMLLSACTQSLSTAPTKAKSAAATPTVNAFATPLTPNANPMAMVEEFGKQTAVAQTLAAGGVVTTPLAAATTAVPAAITATPGVPSNTTAVANNPTSVPSGSRPTTYSLQAGEFPYCIARRFNVDPDQLLSLSGMTSPDVYYEGQKLTIPQSGSFPGSRSLANHPTTYTASSGETLYSIACKYGDVDPSAIANANGISVSAKLTSGQQIKIP